jgi:predicted Fe-Mo cluster-binding NifX family protein
MKVAVTSEGRDLDSRVDPRFGRSRYLLVIDSETLDNKVLENESSGSAHGAGIGTAQTLVREGVKSVITGRIGPNAYNACKAAGIKVYSGFDGIVRDAVEKLSRGELELTHGPDGRGHQGMGGGMGRRRQGLDGGEV